MFKSAFEMKSVAGRIAAVTLIASLVLGLLEYARLAVLPAHFV